MAKLTSAQIAKGIKSLKGWKASGGAMPAIAKTFNFKNYYETMAFVNATAWISHAEDHHPDLEVGYNKCKVTYSTHSAGGVTEKDLQCAAQVERLMK
jgi:4a-hydroxytetrahydrobiopterin dehydratase